MAYETLQALVGTAVIDSEFRRALLNGSRRQVVKSLNLTDEELDIVMAIRAETLEQFAGMLDQWIMKKCSQVEPPALTLPIHPRPSRERINPLGESARLRKALAPAPAS